MFLVFSNCFKHPYFPKKHSSGVNIRVFGVSKLADSHETLGIEKDFYGIPEIYGYTGANCSLLGIARASWTIMIVTREGP